MLKIKRYSKSGIIIGDNIRVYVSKVHKDGMVELDIHAPPEVKILREELLRRSENNQKEGAQKEEPKNE